MARTPLFRVDVDGQRPRLTGRQPVVSPLGRGARTRSRAGRLGRAGPTRLLHRPLRRCRARGAVAAASVRPAADRRRRGSDGVPLQCLRVDVRQHQPGLPHRSPVSAAPGGDCHGGSWRFSANAPGGPAACPDDALGRLRGAQSPAGGDARGCPASQPTAGRLAGWTRRRHARAPHRRDRSAGDAGRGRVLDRSVGAPAGRRRRWPARELPGLGVDPGQGFASQCTAAQHLLGVAVRGILPILRRVRPAAHGADQVSPRSHGVRRLAGSRSTWPTGRTGDAPSAGRRRRCGRGTAPSAQRW